METLMYVISFKRLLGLINIKFSTVLPPRREKKYWHWRGNTLKKKINTDSYRSSQLSFNKGAKVIQWRKDSVSMVKLEEFDIQK